MRPVLCDFVFSLWPQRKQVTSSCCSVFICLVKWSHQNIWQQRCTYKGLRQFYVFWLILFQSLQFFVTFAICYYFLCIDGSPCFQNKTLTLAEVKTIHCAKTECIQLLECRACQTKTGVRLGSFGSVEYGRIVVLNVIIVPVLFLLWK